MGKGGGGESREERKKGGDRGGGERVQWVMRSGNWVRKKWIGECGLYYEGRLQEGGGTREDKILHRDSPSLCFDFLLGISGKVESKGE